MRDRQREGSSPSGAVVGGSIFLLGRVIQSRHVSVSRDWLILGYGKAEHRDGRPGPVVEGGFCSQADQSGLWRGVDWEDALGDAICTRSCSEGLQGFLC